MQALLAVAGLACCVAMSMPQVHIVAYCGDLGYGVANGARMLSLMMGCGIICRVASGFIADRLGGMATLAIGSAAQMTALSLYLTSDGLVSLYVISAMFGLFQGGLVPSYAIVIRENFPASQAGTRVGFVMMMTLLGRTTFIRLRQEKNAAGPILVRPLEKVTFVRPLQEANAACPMLVTLPGSVTPVRLVQ